MTYQLAKLDADCKRRLLGRFRGERQLWENKTDDRKLFCNIYDMLQEALDVMESIDNSTIWVAFNHKFNDERRTLLEISDRFDK